MSRVWIFVSSSHRSTQRDSGLLHLFLSQDAKFILTAHKLEFVDDPKLLHTTAQKEGSV